MSLTTTIGGTAPQPEPEDGPVKIRVLVKFTGTPAERARYCQRNLTSADPNPSGCLEPGCIMQVTEARAAELCDRPKPLAVRVNEFPAVLTTGWTPPTKSKED